MLMEDIIANSKALTKLDNLELSVLTAGPLSRAGFIFAIEIAEKTEEELRQILGGRKRTNEVKEVLENIGLPLGLKIEDRPSSRAEFLNVLIQNSDAGVLGRIYFDILVNDQTNQELGKFLGEMYHRAGCEVGAGGSMPLAVRKELLAALKLAAAVDEFSKR